MLMPKRVKRRRVHRGRMKGEANKGNQVAYGEYGFGSFGASLGCFTSNSLFVISNNSLAFINTHRLLLF